MSEEYKMSQKPALDLLQSMGYTYLSPEDCKAQRGNSADVILKDILRGQLRKINSYSHGGVTNEFSAQNIEKAMDDLDYPLTEGLLTSSEKIYNMLMLGNSYPEPVAEGRLLNFNINYIDWKKPENNVFHVTKEYFVENSYKEHDSRPDIVLFLNGIPFAVIECKAPEESVNQAISQMIRNQKTEYIPQLFKFSQILMATNKDKVRYATTYTPKKFWNQWREEDSTYLNEQIKKHISPRTATEQDKSILSLFEKSRVLEFFQYFIIFDGKIKKICRYQQYFGIKATLNTVTQRNSEGNRCGGVIWHTQGSGKSLTMVMLAKYLLSVLESPKIVIVTDRKELDQQISKTFALTRLRPATATTGGHLVELLRDNKADIVTTIINKFHTAEKKEAKFESTEVFVLVDESHRSNYKQLAAKMRAVFPNACFLGFTGTPLMKKEKNTAGKFGGFIHKYTISQAVEDGAIVPLIYESRWVEQAVDEENIDLWFTEMTKRLNEKQRVDLMRKWSSIQRLTSTEARIKRVALDINKHYTENILPLGFGGMIATNSKKDAVRYLKILEMLGDVRAAVVISPPDVREGTEDVDDIPDDQVLTFWTKMMNQYSNADDYEKSIKARFEDGELDILIVCSKLLTGFDAPNCQVLYIDKQLREHGLLQAIARTNRLRDGKEYGLIVDYRGLIKELDEAMEVYSGAGLDEFDPADLRGTVVDVMSAVTNLYDSYGQLEDFFFTIKDKEDTEAFEVYLAEEECRESFYQLVSRFGRDLYLLLSSEIAFQAVGREKLDIYQQRLIFYIKMRKRVKIRYCDALDHAEYEPLMQNLLDTHLSVVGLKQLTKPVDILEHDEFQEELKELGSLRAKADAITHRMTKSISEKYDENPAYYDSFSKRIVDVLEEYKEKIITDSEYLKRMSQILEDYGAGKTEIRYPDVLKNNLHAQAFYGVLQAIWSEFPNVNQNLLPEITLEISNIVERNSKVDFSTNITVHNKIAQEIDDLFYRYEDKGLKFDFDTVDKMIENVKSVALRRF